MSGTSQKLYPEIVPLDGAHGLPSAPSPYPSLDMRDMVENLFPGNDSEISGGFSPREFVPSAPPELSSMEELLIRVPGAILNLVDKHYSVDLASGDLVIVRLRQGENTIAVLARVGDEIQWPVGKDAAAVKLDDSHYFFSLYPSKKKESDLRDGEVSDPGDDTDILNYGLTIASKGQENLLKEFDALLDHYSNFSAPQVLERGKESEMAPTELFKSKSKELMEGRCAAYWTALAPNVEDYSGTSARMIATGSGHLIKGILWCGDVTTERLKVGHDVMKKRISRCSSSEIRPETMKRIKRAKKITKMTEKVASGVLSGVVKVSGFVTSSIANSKTGKKIFSLLPEEVVLASLDGFDKVCDAVEVAGKNVMSTSSSVTTGIVSQRYGEEAAAATSEGLDAAGHAIGTAWAVFKIRKALNPKNLLKPSKLVKSVAKAGARDWRSKSSSL